MVKVRKQNTLRTWDLRYQSTHLQTPDFWEKKGKRYKMGKKAYLTNGAGITEYQNVKE